MGIRPLSSSQQKTERQNIGRGNISWQNIGRGNISQQNINPKKIIIQTRTNKGWTALLLVCSLLLILPLLGPLLALIQPASDNWERIARSVLWDYARGTLVLMIGVAFGASLLGILPAWVMSRYELPRFLDTLLVLPLSIPAYITGYAYSGMFDFFGPVWNAGVALGIPADIMNAIRISNMPGLIFVMSCAFYPYLYMAMKNSFSRGIGSQMRAAQSLGRGEIAQFFKLALPLCRPALVASLFLVIMETINEYGAVLYFGQNTLSVGILRTWFAQYDLPSAQRLSGIVVLFVFSLLVVENLLRGKRGFEDRASQGAQALEKIHPAGAQRVMLMFMVLLPPLVGYFLPLLQILSWALWDLAYSDPLGLMEAAANTVLVSLGAALFLAVLSIGIAYARRLETLRSLRKFSDLSLLGQSIPGSVIALGLLGISQGLIALSRPLGIPVLLSGSLVFLLYAYCIRFLGEGERFISSVMRHRLSLQDEASRSLGKTPLQTLIHLHIPNLKIPIVTVLIVAILELSKELPLSIMLAPFNFQTLAVHIHQLASSELVREAAIPALVLISFSTILIILLRRMSNLYGQ